jgi:ABC-type nitrate/sulfonate/bicarbonate transport system substrate-binding protein
MQRRDFLSFSAGAAAHTALSPRAFAQSGVKEIRVGYQKNGVLVITRQQAALEKHFAPQGIEVKWVEFSSAPPMMEAMNVGSVDYGAVGDSPPVFAQTIAANRSSFVVGPITEDIIATQQGVADRFHKLGLIPKPIVVRDIVWRNAQT